MKPPLIKTRKSLMKFRLYLWKKYIKWNETTTI